MADRPWGVGGGGGGGPHTTPRQALTAVLENPVNLHETAALLGTAEEVLELLPLQRSGVNFSSAGGTNAQLQAISDPQQRNGGSCCGHSVSTDFMYLGNLKRLWMVSSCGLHSTRSPKISGEGASSHEQHGPCSRCNLRVQICTRIYTCKSWCSAVEGCPRVQPLSSVSFPG